MRKRRRLANKMTIMVCAVLIAVSAFFYAPMEVHADNLGDWVQVGSSGQSFTVYGSSIYLVSGINSDYEYINNQTYTALKPSETIPQFVHTSKLITNIPCKNFNGNSFTLDSNKVYQAFTFNLNYGCLVSGAEDDTWYSYEMKPVSCYIDYLGSRYYGVIVGDTAYFQFLSDSGYNISAFNNSTHSLSVEFEISAYCWYGPGSDGEGYDHYFDCITFEPYCKFVTGMSDCAFQLRPFYETNEQNIVDEINDQTSKFNKATQSQTDSLNKATQSQTDSLNKATQSQTNSLNKATQEQTNTMVNGFDNSQGDNVNADLSAGLNEYQTSEDSLFATATTGMKDFTFFDIESVPAMVTGMSFITSIMGKWFNEAGGASGVGIVLSILFSVMLVSMVLGLYRLYQSAGHRAETRAYREDTMRYRNEVRRNFKR